MYRALMQLYSCTFVHRWRRNVVSGSKSHRIHSIRLPRAVPEEHTPKSRPLLEARRYQEELGDYHRFWAAGRWLESPNSRSKIARSCNGTSSLRT